jgi:hypothetical protein
MAATIHTLADHLPAAERRYGPTVALRLSREVAEYHRRRHEALLGAGVCIGFGSLCGGLAAFLLFGAVFAGSWVLGALCAVMLALFCVFMRWSHTEIAEYRNLYEEYHHVGAARTRAA